MDREVVKLQAQEKKLMIEIKKSMKESPQLAVAQIKAKDVVRTRNMISKFTIMKSHMQSISLRLQTVKSTQAMQEAMKGAAKAMARMNAQTDLQGLNKILNDFQKENDIMLTKQEQMDEGLDEMFAADNEEGKIDDLVGQVLAEIGIETQLPGAKGKSPIGCMGTRAAPWACARPLTLSRHPPFFRPAVPSPLTFGTQSAAAAAALLASVPCSPIFLGGLRALAPIFFHLLVPEGLVLRFLPLVPCSLRLVPDSAATAQRTFDRFSPAAPRL
mmetsp:Transcript_28112/g.74204  ORF Transcript_28112/g.74204 Transcript_28112/m.74204 type:complete len:272 (+) Transcript_28112:222-1037(+)